MQQTLKTFPTLDEEYFLGFGKARTYKKNQIIIMPEDEPEGVFYLKSGFVRLYLISKDGKELDI